MAFLKSKVYATSGEWFAFHKAWKKGEYRKVVRNSTSSTDIILLEDGMYKIYTAFKLTDFIPSFVSTSANEPRPFYYIVEKRDVLKLYPSLNEKLLNTLDSKLRIKDELA